MSSSKLQWPEEAVTTDTGEHRWRDQVANCALDFHGDPWRASLAVLSDGNHYMALEQALSAFAERTAAVDDIFYVTLPPGVLDPIFKARSVRLGNLRLPIEPHVLIGPRAWLRGHADAGHCDAPRPFARSLGNSLLVRRGNPLGIQGVADLYQDDVRLFISNPVREQASHRVYRDTLVALATAQGLDAALLAERLAQGREGIVHGEHVHHREAPAALHADSADTAVLYDHLALRLERVFPDRFQRIPLPGAGTDPVGSEQVTTTYAIACIEGMDAFLADALAKHFCDGAVAAIYRSYGLATA